MEDVELCKEEDSTDSASECLEPGERLEESNRSSSNSKQDIGLNQIHFPKKPFQCQLCENRYNKKGYLKKHKAKKQIKKIGEKRHNLKNHEAKECIKMKCHKSKCIHCYQYFIDLEGHKRRRHTQVSGDNLCKHCKRAYSTKSYLERHIKNSHFVQWALCQENTLTNEAPSCENYDMNSKYLKQHRSLYHSNGMFYQCIECQKTFNKKFSLIMHYKKHKQAGLNKAFLCTKCGSDKAVFDSEYKLIAHIKSEHCSTPSCVVVSNTKPHSTSLPSVFGEQYSSKSQNDSGLGKNAVGYGPGATVCLYCGKPFSTISDLITHNLGHRLDKAIKCNFKLVLRRTNASLETIVLQKVREYTCCICELSYIDPALFEEHMNDHTGIKVFQCWKCDKTFNEASCLTDHIKTHDEMVQRKRTANSTHYSNIKLGHKGFACIFCKRHFPSSEQCTTHKLAHCLDAKLYVEQEILFDENYQLKTLFNDNGTSNKCHKCNNAFLSAFQLKKHMINTHSWKAVFTCFQCETQFKDADGFDRHMHGHVDLKVFQCFKCDQTFIFASELRIHLDIHYKEAADRQTLQSLMDVSHVTTIGHSFKTLNYHNLTQNIASKEQHENSCEKQSYCHTNASHTYTRSSHISYDDEKENLDLGLSTTTSGLAPDPSTHGSISSATILAPQAATVSPTASTVVPVITPVFNICSKCGASFIMSARDVFNYTMSNPVIIGPLKCENCQHLV